MQSQGVGILKCPVAWEQKGIWLVEFKGELFPRKGHHWATKKHAKNILRPDDSPWPTPPRLALGVLSSIDMERLTRRRTFTRLFPGWRTHGVKWVTCGSVCFSGPSKKAAASSLKGLGSRTLQESILFMVFWGQFL